MKTKNGIVYVSWGEKHTKEAVKSATTARQHGHSTCLLTDTDVDYSQYFDFQRKVDLTPFDGMDKFMKKWICLTNSPFEVSCFLDTDTYVQGSLKLGFDLAEQFGICMTFSPGMMFHYQHEEYLHYNGGVMFFKGLRPDLLEKFLETAEELNGSGLTGDEPVFSIVFRRHGINPCVLPTIFNTIRAGQIHNRKIKVYHSRFFPATHLVSDQFGNEFTHDVRGY